MQITVLLHNDYYPVYGRVRLRGDDNREKVGSGTSCVSSTGVQEHSTDTSIYGQGCICRKLSVAGANN